MSDSIAKVIPIRPDVDIYAEQREVLVCNSCDGAIFSIGLYQDCVCQECGDWFYLDDVEGLFYNNVEDKKSD